MFVIAAAADDQLVIASGGGVLFVYVLVTTISGKPVLGLNSTHFSIARVYRSSSRPSEPAGYFIPEEVDRDTQPGVYTISIAPGQRLTDTWSEGEELVNILVRKGDDRGATLLSLTISKRPQQTRT
jgi:hypothetical protein